RIVHESQNGQVYYYTVISHRAVILSMIFFNTRIMVLLSVIGHLAYSLPVHIPAGEPVLYSAPALLGSMSFASVFTMVSGISAKASNNSTLMAILSFPVIIPLLIVLISLSQNALAGAPRVDSTNDIVVLLAINVITVTISLLLFPYLWRD